MFFVCSVAGLLAVVAGAGALAAAYTAGTSSRFGTIRHEDINTELIGRVSKPLLVDEALMNSLHGELYEFTHKAIWGCYILLPDVVHKVMHVLRNVTYVPSPVHWAFVARGECRAVDPPRVAYFISQFAIGDVIPPLEEAEQYGSDNSEGETRKPFRAILQEENKAHACLFIIQGPSHPDVWIQTPAIEPRRYVYKDMRLVSREFRDDEWVPMRKKLNLRELNNHVYTTRCTGKDYSNTENNCQHFAEALFNDV